MIKVQKKPFRSTTADWFYLDPETGEEKTGQITVQYYPLTVKQIKDNKSEMEARQKADPNAFLWLSEILLPRIHALPDLIDEDEKPVEVTLELLETQDVRNLKNIQDAIDADENPK